MVIDINFKFYIPFNKKKCYEKSNACEHALHINIKYIWYQY